MAMQTDTVFELLELCDNLLVNIEQQLLYCRASVYKNETAHAIEDKIAKLQNVLKMFNNNALLEPLTNYRALQLHNLELAPGECSFTRKITTLVNAVRMQLRCYQTSMPAATDFNQQIRQNRQQLLSLCRQGSRQWSFFRSL